jgi:hypothetical protein
MLRLLKLAVLAAVALVAPVTVGAQPGDSARDAVVGVAPFGQNAIEFIGQIDQVGPSFTGYGYLTHVAGLPDAALFASPTVRDESTARLTFFATSTATARYLMLSSGLPSLHDVSSQGQFTFYFNPTPGGSFANPLSFASGTPVASSAVRLQDILSIYAPGQGIATGYGDGVQSTASAFTLDGQRVRLGMAGLRERFTTNGRGTLTGPTGPNSTIIFAGNAVVTNLDGQSSDRGGQ